MKQSVIYVIHCVFGDTAKILLCFTLFSFTYLYDMQNKAGKAFAHSQ